MKDIRCPQCGCVISMDDADYAAIVNQVRSDEFNAEVKRRLEEAERVHQSEEARRAAEADATHAKDLSARDAEIARLRQELAGLEEKQGLELAKLRLEEQRKAADAIARKDEELRAQKEALSKVRSDAEEQRRNAESRQLALTEQHRLELEAKDKEVAFYRDFKARRSVKLLGEDLEQYCADQFNQTLRPVMPSASFEKDNDAVREDGEAKGSKGDFIFRDRVDGAEYLSIMFEMKNESDESSTRHRNADFFDKLDKDRKKKGCEYAVLVSMLELDNDMYNKGIVVAPGYEKMYVVRPDNFISIITLLVQTSMNAAEAKKELLLARSQSVDITHFEEQLHTFKDGFSRNFDLATRQFQKAVDEINATIKHLENVRDNLTKSQNNLRLANDKAEDLTIRKLTYKNPTMKAAFDEARAKREAEEGPDEQ